MNKPTLDSIASAKAKLAEELRQLEQQESALRQEETAAAHARILELLSTFGQDLGEVALIPGEGGVFRIAVDDVQIWDRKEQGGFPEAAQLKQLVRDRIDPARDLGHNDR